MTVQPVLGFGTVLLSLSASALSTIGIAYFFKAFLETGIKEAVKHSFSKQLEEYKAQLTREMEQLRTSLNNSETRFAKQLEALASLRRILRKIVPKRSSPEMDWDDACVEIVHSISVHADAVDEFLCSYGAVLPPAILQGLDRAATLASQDLFEWNSGKLEPSDESQGIANEFCSLVRAAVEELQTTVDGQVAEQPV